MASPSRTLNLLLRRTLRTSRASPASIRPLLPSISGAIIPPSSALLSQRRPFSAHASLRKGIMPDTSNPDKAPTKTETKFAVAELSSEEYNDLADEYMNDLLEKFETLQDNGAPIDVEYSSGVMTVTVAGKGTYVINKQPPNKQIWLSSPLSGPKRYDFCVESEGQGDKEGTALGTWIYTRDNSSLDELILKEIEMEL
ncbi:Frataxin [Trichoderma citrinoviride]|uniref:ferroxidase n=1 Tax=Trichoderma citrinoviride TaxID=58853 RepID=A0A2T4BAW6_9HYPO|nr:Frataxin [Trichoderma citrinoviride]PTB66457.1 Frataxin [Trichoderma citrinoviride]